MNERLPTENFCNGTLQKVVVVYHHNATTTITPSTTATTRTKRGHNRRSAAINGVVVVVKTGGLYISLKTSLSCIPHTWRDSCNEMQYGVYMTPCFFTITTTYIRISLYSDLLLYVWSCGGSCGGIKSRMTPRLWWQFRWWVPPELIFDFYELLSGFSGTFKHHWELLSQFQGKKLTFIAFKG